MCLIEHLFFLCVLYPDIFLQNFFLLCQFFCYKWCLLLVRFLRGFLRDPNPLKYILDNPSSKKVVIRTHKQNSYTVYCMDKLYERDSIHTVKSLPCTITIRMKGDNVTALNNKYLKEITRHNLWN
jgi:hypothetical protein